MRAKTELSDQLAFHSKAKRFLTQRILRDFNYQLLEFLGDGILKFLTCFAIFAKHCIFFAYYEDANDDINEERQNVFILPPPGELTLKIEQLISNKYFAESFQQNSLFCYVHCTKFPKTLHVVKHRKQPLSDKTRADVIEAVIGAAYLSNMEGMEVATTHSFEDCSLKGRILILNIKYIK